jgi:hypothetical protein
VTHNSCVPIISKELTLQSRFSRVLTVIIVLICAVTEVFVIREGDAGLALRAAAPLGLVAYGAFVLFWAPLIRLSPTSVEIVNPVQTFVVSWPAIQNIETRWGLTLDTPTKKITAWASPAQSRYSSLSKLRRDSFGRADYGAEQVRGRRDNAPFSVAGLAPMLITMQWEKYRDAGLLGAVDGTGFTRRWHRNTLIATSALVVLSVVAAAI